MASCFTLLRWITRLKTVNSKIRSRIHSPTWKGIPRRVHATVTNPAWITHLLRTIFANSDVECILRVKRLQLHLTGMGRWRDPRKIEKVPSPCPVLDDISWQIAKTVQIEKIESKLFGNGMVVLGLATSHVRKWSRYVTKASLRHITTERPCLRLWMTARPCIHPLLK